MTLDIAPSISDREVMANRAPQLFGDQIRQAIRDADCSCYAIWQATGIDQAVLSKFLKGERGMSLESIDKVAHFLDLQIVVRGSTNRKGK
jgi:plasmid maintenance system antidote protein VapI